jgi:hypothetical protein
MGVYEETDISGYNVLELGMLVNGSSLEGLGLEFDGGVLAWA